MLTPKEIAYEVTKALDAKKGQNIKLLKIDRVRERYRNLP